MALPERFARTAARFDKQHRLGDRTDGYRDDLLVSELCKLTGAVGANMRNTAKGREDVSHLLDKCGITARHDRQRSSSRTNDAAGNRRIDMPIPRSASLPAC
jgi:hypothetical protein